MMSMCLSLAVAGCVLWTSHQDVALSLLETELGLRAAYTKGQEINGKEPVFPLWKQVLRASGESVPPSVGRGHPTHYLLLGMK